jgi:hypothetical protein
MSQVILYFATKISFRLGVALKSVQAFIKFLQSEKDDVDDESEGDDN